MNMRIIQIQVTDLNSDTTKHYIGKGTFAFAISVIDTEYLKLNAGDMLIISK